MFLIANKRMYVDDLKIMLNKQIMKDVPRIIIILSNLPI